MDSINKEGITKDSAIDKLPGTDNCEIYFPKGIPGFESMHKFFLIRDEEAPLAQLISAENDQIGFIVVRPESVVPDYSIEIDKDSAGVLQLKPNVKEPVEIWTIMTLNPNDVAKSTINLRAPIVLNMIERLGLQVILDQERLSPKHSLSGITNPNNEVKGAVD